MKKKSKDDDQGVLFPLADGKRSTMAVGREAFAVAFDAIDPKQGQRVRATKDWRGGYMGPVRDLVDAGARSPEASLTGARAGLSYLYEVFEYCRGTECTPLLDALKAQTEDALSTIAITGDSSAEPVLRVPYRGRELEGYDLRRQLRTWVESRAVEPSFSDAMKCLIDNPDWLDLSDLQIVVLGAGAELGPLRHLLEWGAQVWAVDLPGADRWQRIMAAVAGTPGVLHLPVPADSGLGPDSDPDKIAEVAGADLIHSTPEISRWISGIAGPLVIGNYGYADGALNVRLSMACDAISRVLMDSRKDVTLAFLATPTDAFQVPMEIVTDAEEQWDKRWLTRLTRHPLRLANLFQPNYRKLAHTMAGEPVGVADCIVEQQGPNYLLAKRLQRWRAIVAREDGYRVSLNVAPATRTRSVVKNKLLAAAYLGATRFGVEVFDSDTCNALMAALLVRDLRDSRSAANPETVLAHPVDLFSEAAAHGGLWRSPYDPRSMLGTAAVLGMFEQAF